jgi:hypothetical protein
VGGERKARGEQEGERRAERREKGQRTCTGKESHPVVLDDGCPRKPEVLQRIANNERSLLGSLRDRMWTIRGVPAVASGGGIRLRIVFSASSSRHELNRILLPRERVSVTVDSTELVGETGEREVWKRQDEETHQDDGNDATIDAENRPCEVSQILHGRELAER